MPDAIVKETIREIEPLSTRTTIGEATRRVIDDRLPALPAVDARATSPGSSASVSSWWRSSPATWESSPPPR